MSQVENMALFEKKKNLEEISKFIYEKSKDVFKDFYMDNDIQQTKKILEENSGITPQDFTFTVGEINAYLG